MGVSMGIVDAGIVCPACGAMAKVTVVEPDHLVLFNEITGAIQPLWRIRVRCGTCGKKITAKAQITREEGEELRGALAERDAAVAVGASA